MTAESKGPNGYFDGQISNLLLAKVAHQKVLLVLVNGEGAVVADVVKIVATTARS